MFSLSAGRWLEVMMMQRCWTHLLLATAICFFMYLIYITASLSFSSTFFDLDDIGRGTSYGHKFGGLTSLFIICCRQVDSLDHSRLKIWLKLYCSDKKTKKIESSNSHKLIGRHQNELTKPEIDWKWWWIRSPIFKELKFWSSRCGSCHC